MKKLLPLAAALTFTLTACTRPYIGYSTSHPRNHRAGRIYHYPRRRQWGSAHAKRRGRRDLLSDFCRQ